MSQLPLECHSQFSEDYKFINLMILAIKKSLMFIRNNHVDNLREKSEVATKNLLPLISFTNKIKMALPQTVENEIQLIFYMHQLP